MGAPTLTASYVPAAMRPALVVAVALALGGIAAALAGVWFGWILTAFALWSAANVTRRMRHRGPVLTLDAAGTHDHRTGLRLAWPDVESMRTVDRRVVVTKVPLLELVPREPAPRPSQVGPVLRGDLAFADARDTTRLMFDLHHLDVTPEQVLAAARELRGA